MVSLSCAQGHSVLLPAKLRLILPNDVQAHLPLTTRYVKKIASLPFSMKSVVFELPIVLRLLEIVYYNNFSTACKSGNISYILKA